VLTLRLTWGKRGEKLPPLVMFGMILGREESFLGGNIDPKRGVNVSLVGGKVKQFWRKNLVSVPFPPFFEFYIYVFFFFFHFLFWTANIYHLIFKLGPTITLNFFNPYQTSFNTYLLTLRKPSTLTPKISTLSINSTPTFDIS